MTDFDFDECVGIANRPVKDLDGYVKGKLISIDIKNVDFKKPRSKNDFEDDIVQKVFMFTFMMQGKTEPIKMTKMTGTKISTDVRYVKGKGRGSKEIEEYNSLTELCLRLGIFNKKDIKEDNDNGLLNSLRDAKNNITEEEPIYIKTKLENNDKSSEFENIKVRTIQLIDKF